MQIVFKKVIVVFLTLFCFLNVHAATDKSCAINQKLDPVDKVQGGEKPTKGLIYDLTYLTVKDNTMYLLGWAFESATNQTSPKIRIAFIPEGEKMGSAKGVYFTTTSAQPNTANCGFRGCDGDPSKPKFYDLSYWNCNRQNVSAGNRCFQNSFFKLQGGFSASLDLGKLDANKKYKAWIELTGTKVYTKQLAIVKSHVDQNVQNNNVINIETAKGTRKVEIKKTEFKDTVKVVASYGRLNGSSGFHCNSVIADWGLDAGSTYFNWYAGSNTFKITNTVQVQACRGGSDACDHAKWGQYAAGDILMYNLDINRSNVIGDIPNSWTNSKGSRAFAPATWLNFEGSIAVEVKIEEPPKEEPGDPFTTDPNKCVGKDVYSVYYLLQHGLDERTAVSDTSRSLNLMADKKILETVTGDPNKGFEWIETQGEGIVTVVNKASKDSEMDLKEYHERRYKGPYDENLMYNEGKNYYVMHAFYRNKWGKWKNSTTGCEVKITKGTDAVPEEFEYIDKSCPLNKSQSKEDKNKDWNVYKNLAISVKNASIDTFEGNKQHNKNNGLVVTRSYDADKKYLIADPNKNVATEKGPFLQQPLVYRWDICLKDDGEPEPEIPDCSDDYAAASCVEGEEGTGGYFNESDDLKTCTLSKNVDSGFLIVENDYCTVGCKDDISALLPTYKSTKAGQYFLLDNNIPTVTGKRTCVTNKIDYDKYDQDLKTLGDKMISEYNTSKDYEERAEDFASDKVQIEEHKETKTLNTCCGGNCLGDSEAYAIYVKNDSDYQSLSDLKGKVIARFVHDVSLSLHINGAIKDEYNLDFYVNKVGIVRDNDVNEIQKLFDNDEIDAVLIQIGAASGLKGVRAIEGSGAKVETIEYTYKKWKVPARTKRRPNSNVNPNDFAEKTGDYGGVSDVSCQNGTVVETELGKDSFEDEKKKMEAAAKSARNNYLNALREYKDVITNFNKCFSWTDKAPTVRNIGEDNYSIESAKSGENFEYQFNPKVTFSYEDEDSSVFGNMPFDYKSQKLNILSTDDPDPKRYYWDRTTDIDEKYSKDTNEVKSGYNDIGFSLSKRNYLNCYGKDTCTTDSTIEGDFYNNTAYIKREEEKTYTYHLPQIYTLIPSGKLSGSDLKPNIPLPKEAVPVNINTKAGLYDYYISVKEISDKIRKEKSLTKETDQFEKRYSDSKALGNYEGVNEVEEGYMCHYKVENEIYTPPGDPNKLGEINFFYRPVDTYDISHPNNYPLGPNWSDARGQEVQQRIKKDAEDYQELIKDVDKGRFTFRLTPTVMKQIRYYNGEQSIKEENSFADFNLSCYDKGNAKGYHCYSPFLSCLASSGQNKEGSEQTKIASCETIFKNTLNNHETKYGYSDLKRNREYLINKQEELDRQEEVME